MPSRSHRIGIFLSIIGVINIAIAVAIHQYTLKDRARTETALPASAAPSAPPTSSTPPSALLDPIPPDSAPTPAQPQEPAPTAAPPKSAQSPKPFDEKQTSNACAQCNARACLDLADYDARGHDGRGPSPAGARLVAKKACTECGGATNPATAKRCAAWGFAEQ